MDDNLQRKSEKLYGPQRLVEAELQSRKLKKDNVLVKGMVYDSPYDPRSTARDSFKDPFVGKVGETKAAVHWDSSAQHKTSISFGSSKDKSTSLFQDDFTTKPYQYKGLVVPKEAHENHWTDCNPKYALSEQTSSSVYGSDFDGSKSYREWLDGAKVTGQRVGRRNKTTGYQKSTHFTLGSDSLDMLTETQKNFVDSEGSVELGKPDSQQVHEEKPGGDQDLSCVFRKGDYNVTDEKATERFESINRKDFTSKDSASLSPGTVSENFTGQKYQTSTHFEFGTARDEGGSVYYEDYVKDSAHRVPVKDFAPPPPGGKVFPEIPDATLSWGFTTNRSCFHPHNMEERESDRLTNMKENQARHNELAVTLTCRETKDPLTTVMRSSYQGKGCGTRPVEPAVPPKLPYRHLESNDALPNPTRQLGHSESQDSYRASGSQAVKGPVNTERHTRRRDNKSTHFHLGFDEEQNISEQMEEYKGKPPVDADIPAAGKPMGSALDYPIVSHNVDVCHLQPTAANRTDPGTVASSMQNVLLQRTLLKMDSSQDLQLMKLRKAFLETDKTLCVTIAFTQLL
jgi:hypothetical protein